MRYLWLLGSVHVDHIPQNLSESQMASAIPRFRSRRTVGLLGYLATERRSISRDLLATLFWPDEVSAKDGPT